MTSCSITNIVIIICVWKKSTVLIFPVILSEASSVDQDSLKRVPLQCNIVGTQYVHVCDGSFCVFMSVQIMSSKCALWNSYSVCCQGNCVRNTPKIS